MSNKICIDKLKSPTRVVAWIHDDYEEYIQPLDADPELTGLEFLSAIVNNSFGIRDGILELFDLIVEQQKGIAIEDEYFDYSEFSHLILPLVHPETCSV